MNEDSQYNIDDFSELLNHPINSCSETHSKSLDSQPSLAIVNNFTDAGELVEHADRYGLIDHPEVLNRLEFIISNNSLKSYTLDCSAQDVPANSKILVLEIFTYRIVRDHQKYPELNYPTDCPLLSSRNQNQHLCAKIVINTFQQSKSVTYTIPSAFRVRLAFIAMPTFNPLESSLIINVK